MSLGVYSWFAPLFTFDSQIFLRFDWFYMTSSVSSLVLPFLALGVQLQAAPVSLTSPDGALAMTFQTISKQPASAGRLVYDVTFHGKPLVEQSALSLALEGAPPDGLRLSRCIR